MSTTTDAPPRPARRPWRRWSRRTKVTLSVVAVLLIVGGAVGLALFEPWRLFTRSTVDEAAPTVAAAAPAVTAASPAVVAPATPPPVAETTVAGAVEPAPAAQAPNPVPAEPVELAAGLFVDGEHATSGAARVLQLADGSRIVRLENFSTSDGPDVHVWLTDQAAGGDWGKYDDGRAVPLGELKGTDGSQNYALPADVDLAGLASVVIWCDRFRSPV